MNGSGGCSHGTVVYLCVEHIFDTQPPAGVMLNEHCHSVVIYILRLFQSLPRPGDRFVVDPIFASYAEDHLIFEDAVTMLSRLDENSSRRLEFIGNRTYAIVDQDGPPATGLVYDKAGEIIGRLRLANT